MTNPYTKNLPTSGVVSLENGKYKFILDANGMMVLALRHDEDWPAGYEWRHSKAIMSMLWRIQELELAAIRPVIVVDELDQAEFPLRPK